MLAEREPAAEGLAALAALEGFLQRVDPAVCDQLGALPEGLATLAATEGLLLRVDQLVPQEDGALLEGLAAVGALVGLGPGVDDLVSAQQRVVLERLAAGHAPVGPLLRRVGGAWAPPFSFQGRWGQAQLPASAACGELEEWLL